MSEWPAERISSTRTIAGLISRADGPDCGEQRGLARDLLDALDEIERCHALLDRQQKSWTRELVVKDKELAQTKRALELACMQILMLDGKDSRTYQEWVEWCMRQAEQG